MHAIVLEIIIRQHILMRAKLANTHLENTNEHLVRCVGKRDAAVQLIRFRQRIVIAVDQDVQGIRSL